MSSQCNYKEINDDGNQKYNLLENEDSRLELESEQKSQGGISEPESTGEKGISKSPRTSARPVVPTRKPRRRKNSPEPDYSAGIQEQVAGSNRTLNACDRCRGRKTKCDRNPNGCANCAAKGLPCVTTDRVSGHTVARGELQELRSENQQLQQENDLLRKQLAAYKRTLGGRFQGGTSGNYSQASTPGIGRMACARTECQGPQHGQQAMTPIQPSNAFANPTVDNATGNSAYGYCNSTQPAYGSCQPTQRSQHRQTHPAAPLDPFSTNLGLRNHLASSPGQCSQRPGFYRDLGLQSDYHVQLTRQAESTTGSTFHRVNGPAKSDQGSST